MNTVGMSKDQLIALLIGHYPENERANWARWFKRRSNDDLRRLLAKITPAPTFCTYGACDNAQHDHTTTVDDDGNDLDGRVPVPMLCTHCRKPAHYDYADDRYHHDDPKAPSCFMIH